MRIPFADPHEVFAGERVTVTSPRELRRARLLGQVPVVASGWDGSSWLADLAHSDAVLLITINGDEAGVFFVPEGTVPPTEMGEPGARVWAAIWQSDQVREEPAHRPRAVLAGGERGPHLTLVWEPGTVVDLDPVGGGICYLVPGPQYRRFFTRRRTTP